ncbi:MAG TPA: peroxiredoxin [Thermoanaerobaculia bacterium]|nr:peroxiredoxin [Thermoanaerobaculia bacterium]
MRTLLLPLLLVASSVVAADVLSIGTPAPDFTLATDEGKQAALKDYRGKWVVLYFYPKNFTSGCTIQARNFQRDLAKYEERGAVVIGVSVDSAESHKDFCTKEGLSFRLLSDSDASVSTAYSSVIEHQGAKFSARNTFIIDPEGKIVRVFEKVKVVQHSEEVLAALDELRKR